MNAEHKQAMEKKSLADALLSLDAQMPSNLSEEARNNVEKVMLRDRRRVRILTWITISLILLTIIGICGGMTWHCMKIVYWMDHFRKEVFLGLGHQLSNQGPLSDFALLTAQACHVLYMGQLATVWGTVVLLAFMLAAAICTVLLIAANRRATLRQIQLSLLTLSEQLDKLRQSTHDNRPSDDASAI